MERVRLFADKAFVRLEVVSYVVILGYYLYQGERRNTNDSPERNDRPIRILNFEHDGVRT